MAARRQSASSQRMSSDDDPAAALVPPRPPFLAGRGASDRSSWSSADLEPASESDHDSSSQSLARPRPAVPAAPVSPPRARAAPRTHHRRRSSMAGAAYAPVDPDTPAADHEPGWSPASLYHDAAPSPRPPPSSFSMLFPFQAYPGNPDPGTHIPGLSRRSSVESISMQPRSRPASVNDLPPPNAPFMAGAPYRDSAAAAIASASNSAVDTAPPRNSVTAFRAPFLSPASRPSSLWSPPSYGHYANGQNSPALSPSASYTALALPKSKPPLPSTRLAAKLAKEEKPWLTEKDRRGRASWWLTFVCILLGLGGAGVLCWRGFVTVEKLDPSQLCAELDENFSSLDLDNTWTREVQLGGFGNGEFQMTTNSDSNSYVKNGNLYIMPTLTSDSISGGKSAVLNGANYTLPGCTLAKTNATACSASSNAGRQQVINPVMSARLNTKGKHAIQFGKVEVRAKLPRGDWLWPAIWMLPEDESYGAWPLSGEIDIMEARGNTPAYPAQGSNFVRSTLNYGPLPSLITMFFGWFSSKRTSFDQGFHTYGMEWSPDFVRFYTDTRLNKMLDLRVGKGFFAAGGYPQTAQNGSAEVIVQNPWVWGTPAAPFDKPFYLIIDLAVGGTSGWFPDNKGGKPWSDGSHTAMTDFAKVQDSWAATWPSSEDDRAFRIESVKMWKMC